jgi:hypothetical protein
MINDIEIFRGDTALITCAIKENGLAFDLTDYMIELNVKESYSKLDSEILFTVIGTIENPTTGIGIINLTSVQTNIECKKYVYDIKIYKNDVYEEPIDIKTLKTAFLIIKDVVKREV